MRRRALKEQRDREEEAKHSAKEKQDRERREENLRSLALRVAQQVRNYRRSIALEAMPPHERRIVHIALSDSKDISTESIGEGDARRVVISLKRPGR